MALLILIYPKGNHEGMVYVSVGGPNGLKAIDECGWKESSAERLSSQETSFGGVSGKTDYLRCGNIKITDQLLKMMCNFSETY